MSEKESFGKKRAGDIKCNRSLSRLTSLKKREMWIRYPQMFLCLYSVKFNWQRWNLCYFFNMCNRNLMLPRGMSKDRPWARFRVRIYRAEGLPTMDSGLMAKMDVSDRTVFIDPYVQVTFCGQQVRPPWRVWNNDNEVLFTGRFTHGLCRSSFVRVWSVNVLYSSPNDHV